MALVRGGALNRSHRYYTPLEIATALSRHAPEHISSLLDPAVGKGFLLTPLIEHLSRSAKRVVCVDKDKRALSHVERTIGPILGNRLSLIDRDFLRWRPDTAPNNAFDCIVMNPPFLGTKSQLVKVTIPDSSSGTEATAFVPTEVAFLLKAIFLLKHGGTLLAVVPGSVVAASSTSMVRREILGKGWVKCVHELPRYSFKGVEGRFYLFVFQKGIRQQDLILCNHDLFSPEMILVKRDELSEGRLDYSYNDAIRWIKQVQHSNERIKWSKLYEFAIVIRGSIASPKGARTAVHTCDYANGFWNSNERGKQKDSPPDIAHTRKGDLLIKRVSRGAAKSVGGIVGALGLPCSDCVFIIRATNVEPTRLLFSLRTILAWERGAALVERGTGSTYITEKSLSELAIPTNLEDIYADKYRNYKTALRCKDYSLMMQIEDKIRKHLSASIRGDV